MTEMSANLTARGKQAAAAFPEPLENPAVFPQTRSRDNGQFILNFLSRHPSVLDAISE